MIRLIFLICFTFTANSVVADAASGEVTYRKRQVLRSWMDVFTIVLPHAIVDDRIVHLGHNSDPDAICRAFHYTKAVAKAEPTLISFSKLAGESVMILDQNGDLQYPQVDPDSRYAQLVGQVQCLDENHMAAQYLSATNMTPTYLPDTQETLIEIDKPRVIDPARPQMIGVFTGPDTQRICKAFGFETVNSEAMSSKQPATNHAALNEMGIYHIGESGSLANFNDKVTCRLDPSVKQFKTDVETVIRVFDKRLIDYATKHGFQFVNIRISVYKDQ